MKTGTKIALAGAGIVALVVALKKNKSISGIGKVNPNRSFTRVIFRKFPNGEVIALFPDIEEGFGRCLSYMHMGQHAPADYGIIQRTKLATPDEAADLLNELFRIGYNNLEIAHRV